MIEDEEALREVARRTIDAAGYTVLTAADGEEGLERGASQRRLMLTPWGCRVKFPNCNVGAAGMVGRWVVLAAWVTAGPVACAQGRAGRVAPLPVLASVTPCTEDEALTAPGSQPGTVVAVVAGDSWGIPYPHAEEQVYLGRNGRYKRYRRVEGQFSYSVLYHGSARPPLRLFDEIEAVSRQVRFSPCRIDGRRPLPFSQPGRSLSEGATSNTGSSGLAFKRADGSCSIALARPSQAPLLAAIVARLFQHVKQAEEQSRPMPGPPTLDGWRLFALSIDRDGHPHDRTVILDAVLSSDGRWTCATSSKAISCRLPPTLMASLMAHLLRGVAREHMIQTEAEAEAELRRMNVVHLMVVRRGSDHVLRPSVSKQVLARWQAAAPYLSPLCQVK